MIQFLIRIYFVKLKHAQKEKKKSNSDCDGPTQVPADYSSNNTNVQEVTKRGLERGIFGLRVSVAKKVVKSTYCSSLGPVSGNLL